MSLLVVGLDDAALDEPLRRCCRVLAPAALEGYLQVTVTQRLPLTATVRRDSDPGRALDALGSPIRRQILRILAPGPQPVGQIAAVLPVSRPAVSKHLRILEAADLVTHDVDGTRNLFRLQQPGFDAARRWLDAFWDEALARFVLVAENTRSDP